MNSDSESGGKDRKFNTQYMSSEKPVDTGYKNLHWLRQQVVNYSGCTEGDRSIHGLSSDVFETLKSNRDDAHLEDELFVSLGFYGFNLVHILLKNRKESVDNVTTTAMLDTQKKECKESTNNRQVVSGIWQRGFGRYEFTKIG